MFKVAELKKRHIALITAISGATSAAFANPFWFLNTRIAKDEETSEKKNKKEILATAKEIFQKEGI